jgi:hypothetical protein
MFPNNSTANQFFTPHLFQAYHFAGVAAMEQALDLLYPTLGRPAPPSTAAGVAAATASTPHEPMRHPSYAVAPGVH